MSVANLYLKIYLFVRTAVQKRYKKDTKRSLENIPLQLKTIKTNKQNYYSYSNASSHSSNLVKSNFAQVKKLQNPI